MVYISGKKNTNYSHKHVDSEIVNVHKQKNTRVFVIHFYIGTLNVTEYLSIFS